jgi:hypothetical protein
VNTHSAGANRPPILGISFFSLCALALILSLAPHGSQAAQSGFADPSFSPIWERTDALVLSGRVARSWYWGPGPGQTLQEPYTGSITGTRLVQYFDKARMEVNNPQGDRSSEWFVTTGLLVVDMVSGKQQVGDREFVPRRAAEIAVGGDGYPHDPEAPSYTSFRPVASIGGPGSNRAPNRVGLPVTETINRVGQVGNDARLGLFPGAKLAAYSDVLGHNIPQAMWDFLNLKGPVQQGGRVVEGGTIANWIFVMGYPITEAYWSRVRIEGVYYDVLFQMYERRALTYIPAFPRGWQVQMGNVGQHYYRWLYGGPLPTPQVPLPGPPVPPIPAPVDGVVDPTSAPVGAVLNAYVRAFRPGEAINSWLTAPDTTVRDAGHNLTADADGNASTTINTAGLGPGLWAITFNGRGSSHQSILYFYLYDISQVATPTVPPNPAATGTVQATSVPATGTSVPRTNTPQPTATRTPTTRPGSPSPSPSQPVVPTQPPTGLLLQVRPGFGSPNDEFVFSARGLAGGEGIQVTFYDPSGNPLYPNGGNGRYTADAEGRWSLTLVPSQAFPQAPLGNWVFELRGLASGQEGIVGFTLR